MMIPHQVYMIFLPILDIVLSVAILIHRVSCPPRDLGGLLPQRLLRTTILRSSALLVLASFEWTQTSTLPSVGVSRNCVLNVAVSSEIPNLFLCPVSLAHPRSCSAVEISSFSAPRATSSRSGAVSAGLLRVQVLITTRCCSRMPALDQALHRRPSGWWSPLHLLVSVLLVSLPRRELSTFLHRLDDFFSLPWVMACTSPTRLAPPSLLLRLFALATC